MISRFPKSTSFIFAVMLFSRLAVAELVIGSSNTATADPPVPHPKATPCKVLLFKNYRFADFNPQSFSYAPPAGCAAPWAKVILEANFSVTKGIQFDRTANIWIGQTNVYFGTTSEPDPNNARSWHVERDLTDYSSLFTTGQTGTVDLFNLFQKPYTGILEGTATLYFYPLAPNQKPPATADQVIGFSSGAPGSVQTVALDTTSQCCQPSLADTLTFPTNVVGLYLDVFAQSQHDDEFWYTCLPNDVAGELQNCPNTAFRESEVTIDGTPAGVAPVYPWIFTGGIDPLLWIPIPGVQTLNFKPYRVNLTPFASMVDDGQPHTIALSVFNAANYFSATASLLLYLDHGSTQVTGGVLENSLAAPVPAITENVHIAKNGNLNGTVNTTAQHNFKISGYVNTSRGSVTTTVTQDIRFTNDQAFRITAATYQQNIKQNTVVHSYVTTVDGSGKQIYKVNRNWPLTFDIGLVFNSDGTIDQTSVANQYFEGDEQISKNGQITYFALSQNRVTPTDTLELNSSFQIIGNKNESSAQTYFSSDSTGYCYSESITAANNVLTGVTSGVGCN